VSDGEESQRTQSDEPDIVLVDDEGQEHQFYLYQVVEVEESSYALLQPAESDSELIILRFEGEGDETSLVSISDEEWELVAAALDGRSVDES